MIWDMYDLCSSYSNVLSTGAGSDCDLEFVGDDQPVVGVGLSEDVKPLQSLTEEKTLAEGLGPLY